jgi:hypothetical protein
MSITVRPGDFAALPLAVAPVGAVVSFLEWLADLGKRGDKLPTSYQHAVVYIGEVGPDAPYGKTASVYPGGNGIHVLTCPPDQIRGAIWSSGVISLTGAQRAAVVSWAIGHADATYSALEYVALVAHHFRLPTGLLQSYITSRDQYICSRFVVASLAQAAGVDLFPGTWDGFVTPLDIALLLQGYGARVCNWPWP